MKVCLCVANVFKGIFAACIFRLSVFKAFFRAGFHLSEGETGLCWLFQVTVYSLVSSNFFVPYIFVLLVFQTKNNQKTSKYLS